jgi:hypothetical protein
MQIRQPYTDNGMLQLSMAVEAAERRTAHNNGMETTSFDAIPFALFQPL